MGGPEVGRHHGGGAQWLADGEEKLISGEVTTNQGMGVSREVRQVLVPLPEGRLEHELISDGCIHHGGHGGRNNRVPVGSAISLGQRGK